MKKALVKLHNAALAYVVWGWPVVLLDAALDAWAGEPAPLWRRLLNDAGFAYVLCAAAALVTLVLDKSRRERAMAKLYGVREGDERERAVTGDAAKTTLLLSLSFQIVLLVLSLTTVQLVWNAAAPKGTPHGLLSVGLKFSSSDQLGAFGFSSAAAAAVPGEPGRVLLNGYLLTPAAFPILLALILLQLAAFKAFSRRRYEGMDA
ncbi:MAG TPA: hypothetical protein VH309_06075 [Elusimicrobiota bacterium]|jgi:hypothetical protein|nr:hypothetical protein [Elusimicrobiota bacterium]